MESLKLFMVLIGCKPPGRHTEQHDVFFGIAHALRDLIPEMIAFWPEAKGQLHIDAYREVTNVDDCLVEVLPVGVSGDEVVIPESGIDPVKLFFLNLGGYRKEEFEEYHYKMLAVCHDMGVAARLAKETAFYKHTGFKYAESHIDDKYGIDVDDAYRVEDVLPPGVKEKYMIRITPQVNPAPDELKIGYFKFSKI